MKICSISDTHGITPDFLKKCDILTISGDISPCMGGFDSYGMQYEYFINDFIPFFKNKAKHIIIIGGNHDSFLEITMNNGMEENLRKELPKNVHYLRDSSIIIDGIHFYGTPWTPEFCGWSFMKYDTEDGLGKIFEKIPEGVDILLSHGPAYGYNDKIEMPIYSGSSTKHLGSKMLLKRIKTVRPKNVVVGHIHSGSHKEAKIMHSKEMHSKDLNDYTASVNVSILDEQYEPFYKDIYFSNIKGI